MDYDRKSATSSFYGGRKTSIDALHSDFPASAVQYGQPHAERARHDSASSFYNPNGPSRASVDISSPGYSTAGYNRKSYFPAGRQEPVKGGYDEETTGLNDEPFDIYADFNNQGPRYSTVLGHQDSGYRPVSSPALKMNDEGSSNAGPVEMVTVPALGPEWKASELRDMTKSGRKEAKREQRAEKWKQWKRGERGLCGRYFTRKFTAWFLFVLVCATAIILAFTIPRVPAFAFNSDTPLTTATEPFNKSVPFIFSRAPANFSFPSFADLQLDTGSNFLPLTFNNIHADIFDLVTARQVAQGDLGHMTVPAKKFPRIQIPMNFTYIATNDTDQTWVNWYNACRNKAASATGTRPPIQFRLVLDVKIAGLVGHHFASTQVTDAPCPVELPLNSV
ncbi:unnamed protein product [Somion occarium]|uniref:Late embryogenesis abundant protein LEA-2 subgroup domain-containing protein n=1 Tax=Somion occarium TaxID=3059160 RepID=A0ABP1E142_9APHY